MVLCIHVEHSYKILNLVITLERFTQGCYKPIENPYYSIGMYQPIYIHYASEETLDEKKGYSALAGTTGSESIKVSITCHCWCFL